MVPQPAHQAYGERSVTDGGSAVKLVDAARRHIGVAVTAGVLALGGAGVATAVAVSPASSEDEVFTPPEVTTTAPLTTASATPEPVETPPAPEPAATEVEAPVEAPVDTVDTVTEPEASAPQATDAPPAPQVTQAPAPFDPEAPYEQGGLTYVPAPVIPPTGMPEQQPPVG